MASLTRAISITTKFNNKHLLQRELGVICSSREQKRITPTTSTFKYGMMEGKLVHFENFFDQYILHELAYPSLKFGRDRYDFYIANQASRVIISAGFFSN